MKLGWLQVRIQKEGVFVNIKDGGPRPTRYDPSLYLQWWHCLGVFFRFKPSALPRFWGYREDYYDGPIDTFGLYWFEFWYNQQPEMPPRPLSTQQGIASRPNN